MQASIKAAAATKETPFTVRFTLNAAVDMVALKLWDQQGNQLVQVGREGGRRTCAASCAFAATAATGCKPARSRVQNATRRDTQAL
jgi:hypothetical protein